MMILDSIRSLLESQDFLRELRSEGRIVSSQFTSNERARVSPQGWFISTMLKGALNKLKGCQIFLSITLRLPEDSKVKDALRGKRQVIKKYLCGKTYDDTNPCIKRQYCLEGVFKNTEFDAVIMADEQACILEYEDTWEGICESLAMAHRAMAHGPKDRFAWLFVAPVRSKEAEKKLEAYTVGAKLLFDGVISGKNWAIIGLKY